MKYLLGIDVGTTGTKTLLLRQDGQLCGHAYMPYETRTPAVGRSEQDPEDWWNAVVTTVRSVVQDPQIKKQVAGISLSLQGGTLVPVDAHFRPVRPAIVWNDTGCAPQMDSYIREVGTARTMYEKTGWQLQRGLPALQIRRMREQEPALFQKTAMFLSVPDYLAWKMTGIAAIDPADAGINQLCDIRRGQYDPVLLDFAGITQAQLPRLLRSGEVIGHLTAEAAQALGLTTDTVLTAGVHDQYAVALGAGACGAGDILIGSGTCWVVTCIADAPDFTSGLSQSVAAVPGKWGSLWSLSSGGVCLDWLRKSIAPRLSYEELNREAAVRRAAEDGLFFFPFCGRASETAAFKKGSFTGLDLSHDRFHLARAIMEGVVFQTVWMLDAFPVKPTELKLAGGAAKSALWCRLLADISGLPVRIPEVADLACVGAAVLAGVGSGVYRDVNEGYAALCVGEQVLQPDPVRTAVYKPLLEQYKRCARSLGAVYDQSEV